MGVNRSQINLLWSGSSIKFLVVNSTYPKIKKWEQQDLFTFKQEGIDSQGHARGHFEACDIRPQMLERMREEGLSLPASVFQRRKYI